MKQEFIPLVDLKAQYLSIKDEVSQRALGVLDSCAFILGPDVEKFEKAFASYCGAKYAVSVGSGTDALHLAYRAIGLKEGDEVLIPAMTFVATALGVSLAGAKPVLVDVDKKTGLIDIEQLEKHITPKTKAITPVHLYGQACDLTSIKKLADKYGLRIIDDAAQAHGAYVGEKRIGAIGDATCFSFYPGKNLGAYGDGGLVTTNSDEIYERLILLRNWGSRKKYYHEEMGLNSRLDTIQAAILDVKLKYLDGWNQKRKEHAKRYDQMLKELPHVRKVEVQNDSVYHLYVVRVQNRDQVLQNLNQAGLGAAIHYPFPVHLLGAYQWLGYKKGDFPQAENMAAEILSLPMYAELPADCVERCFKALEASPC